MGPFYMCVITLYLQASADAALSCKPVQPVTRCGCDSGELFLAFPLQKSGNTDTEPQIENMNLI